MEVEGKKYVVLYLEDWQMRIVKDFLGVECHEWRVPVGDHPVMKYFPLPINTGDLDPRAKRMYLTEWQRHEIEHETGEKCEFIVLNPAIMPEYMAPAVRPPEEKTAAPDPSMFQPHVSLIAASHNQYTLYSVTLTPNNSYGTGRVSLDPPPNVRLAPDTLPVRLEITQRRGIVLPVVTPVRHRMHHLEMHGKSRIMAYTIVDETMMGSSMVSVLPAVTPPRPVSVVTSDWHAWVDMMPPGPHSLHVVGTAQVPTPGYEARLVPEAAGSVGGTLRLTLVVEEKPGGWPQVITSLPLHYTIANYTGHFGTVHVSEPDGDTVEFLIGMAS